MPFESDSSLSKKISARANNVQNSTSKNIDSKLQIFQLKDQLYEDANIHQTLGHETGAQQAYFASK